MPLPRKPFPGQVYALAEQAVLLVQRAEGRVDPDTLLELRAAAYAYLHTLQTLNERTTP